MADFYFEKTADESVIDSEGKILFFSIPKFISDICEGNSCFICGAHPEEKEFNDEHILPDWVLRRYSLHNRSIGLPNLTGYRYAQYKIPCCKECNTLMGKEIEEPVRELIDGGYRAITAYLRNSGPWLLFVWMSLIFLKTHLKDKYLRDHIDKRKAVGVISDSYDWTVLHHIHCIARSFYSHPVLAPETLGSFVVLPAKVAPNLGRFDYSDLYSPQSLLIRMDEICLLAVLNDSCGASVAFSNYAKKINGPLSPIQLREVLAHLAFLNMNLKDRPSFASTFDRVEGFRITGNHAQKLRLNKINHDEFGPVLYSLVRGVLPSDFEDHEPEIVKYIREGNYTFLFDKSGEFIRDSMKFQNTTSAGDDP